MKLKTSELPDDLKLSNWDKKKGVLPPESKLTDALKNIARLHSAVPYDEVKDGWVKGFDQRSDLEEALSSRERALRAKQMPLKRALVDLASDARKLLKDKKTAEASASAYKAIVKAAEAFSDEIDADLEALAREVQEALKQWPETEEEEPPALLLDPRKLLAQLSLCKKDGQRRTRFAFVPAKDKRPAVLAMHPKLSPKGLLTQLRRATDGDKGACGTAWVADTVVYLQPDVRFSGLAKAVRAPLKACGFRATKVVLVDQEGKVDEEDDAPDDTVASTQTESGKEEPGLALECRDRLQKLGALLTDLAKSSPADAQKLETLRGFAEGKIVSKEYGVAQSALNKLEEMLRLAADKELSAWNQRWEQSGDNLFKATRRLPSAVSALRPLLDLAQARAAERKFDDALRVLDKLDERLQALETAAKEKAKQLAEQLMPLAGDPPDLDEGETEELARLRQDLQVQLSLDVDLAAQQLKELEQRRQQLAEAAKLRKQEALQSVDRALLELTDPADLDLLP